MNQADIMNAANILAAEFVKPASNGNGYRLVSCKNFRAYLGLAEFACTGASAVDFTLEAARAQIADMLAVAVAKGAEIERTRIGAALAERETDALNRAQKIDAEVAMHRKEANRLSGESAALIVTASDLARLRALATTQDA